MSAAESAKLYSQLRIYLMILCFTSATSVASVVKLFMAKALPKRSENYSEWYNEIVKRADLAENSAVRGCMVIKPYGFAIWEKMQRALDDMFKATGHVRTRTSLFSSRNRFLKKKKSTPKASRKNVPSSRITA